MKKRPLAIDTIRSPEAKALAVKRLLIEQTSKIYERGNQTRWPAAFVAAKLMTERKYERGAAAELARALKLDGTSYIYTMAHAGITYNRLRDWINREVEKDSRGESDVIAELPYIGVGFLRELRRQTKFTHFAVLGELWAKHKFSPVEAIEYLRQAAQGHWRVSELRGAIDAKYGDGGGPDAPPLELDSVADLERTQRGFVKMAGARAGTLVKTEKWGDGDLLMSVSTQDPPRVLEPGDEVWYVVVHRNGKED